MWACRGDTGCYPGRASRSLRRTWTLLPAAGCRIPRISPCNTLAPVRPGDADIADFQRKVTLRTARKAREAGHGRRCSTDVPKQLFLKVLRCCETGTGSARCHGRTGALSLRKRASSPAAPALNSPARAATRRSLDVKRAKLLRGCGAVACMKTTKSLTTATVNVDHLTADRATWAVRCHLCRGISQDSLRASWRAISI